ncbi:putative acetyltransferase [Brucella thiophenivorans]|uniref:Putative acetyltransferase n=1 Tax=Brucella thiophenivorans TaxID=571255 RepID=A0A256FD36_9HYPH|nr:putative acetyltransferase [Brucella thiophenivorans]
MHKVFQSSSPSLTTKSSAMQATVIGGCSKDSGIPWNTLSMFSMRNVPMELGTY